LQGVYQWLLNNEDSGVIDAHIRQAHGFDKADREHFDALLHGAINHSIACAKILHLDRPRHR
jgi:N utilization substance protein B